ncbi:MAG: hypothetical protein HOV81_19735 [Kofleriaceae bacterium]|nr:hypothetical protein [Kofleriaceae bacterium]
MPATASETWKFKESTLAPSFTSIDTVDRPEHVFVTPDGQHMIVVANGRTYEVRSPGKRTPGPTRELVWPYVRISPRGDYAVLVQEEGGGRWGMGSDISILRFSDHTIVTTVAGGADPIWIGESTLAFRVGNQAERLDLPSTEPKLVGAPQKTHGCPNAALRGYTRVDESMCPGGRYSRVVAVDPAYTKWLVVDDDGAHDTALRLVDLASGTDRVLADRASHGYPLGVIVSPHGTRYCMTPQKDDNDTYHLVCGRFPEADDQVEVLDLGKESWFRLAWLDDDRALAAGVGIIDLAAGKRIAIDAKLERTARFEGTFGPRYIVAYMGLVYLLDLEARTSMRLDDTSEPGGYHIFADAAAAGRFWATKMDRKSLASDLVELMLVPR